VRSPGYDARHPRTGKRYQIKGRRVQEGTRSASVVRFTHDWDATLLVLLDSDFRAIAIYEASREALQKALSVPGSKARNIRGQLSVSKFKSVGSRRWPPADVEGTRTPIPQPLLELVAEGGSIKLASVLDHGKTNYVIVRNEAALADYLEGEDWSGLTGLEKFRSLNQALDALEKWPWRKLTPRRIAPEVEATIRQRFLARSSSRDWNDWCAEMADRPRRA
jgi:hypothetical protein